MDEILIIGGNAAGLTAASRARRLDSNVRIAVLEKSAHIAYSTCGIPNLLEGSVSVDQLLSFTPEKFAADRRVRVHTETRADVIEPGRKRVLATSLRTGEKVEYGYGKLLLATGVQATVPDIPGTDLQNVFTLVNLDDGLAVQTAITSARRIAIVGAGYVGLEVAGCLRRMGKEVQLFEREHQVMPSIDRDMAQIVEYELTRFGVSVHTGSAVLALVGNDGKVNGVKSRGGLGIQPADTVLLDTGVRPSSALAAGAGLRVGEGGAVSVNAFMETSQSSVLAAGNCAETMCAIRKRPVLHYVGTVAAKQGRVAGENMVGRRTRFAGSVGTTVLKVFDLGVARTGLSLAEAEAERISVVSARIEDLDRASYDAEARKLWVKLVVERESHRLVGAQVVGYGDVAKRIDVAATAITAGMRIDELAQLDLAYAPPFSSLWDPFLVAVQAIQRLL